MRTEAVTEVVSQSCCATFGALERSGRFAEVKEDDSSIFVTSSVALEIGKETKLH